MVNIISFSVICIVIGVLLRIFYLYKQHQKAAAEAWDELEKQNPEEFMADDEWCFVKYHGVLLPMTRFEKVDRWNNMSGAEKREAYLLIKRMADKGRIKKITVDGNTMYQSTNQGKEFLVNRYNKISQEYERRHGKKFSEFKNEVLNKSKQQKFVRQRA